MESRDTYRTFFLPGVPALCLSAAFFATTAGVSAETVRALRPKFTSTMTVAGCTNGQSIALANFPVPVRISTAKIPGFCYGTCDGADDISFSDESGSILPHEVEVWNTEGESVAWVSVPQVYTNSVFYMNWSHRRKLATAHSGDVWTNSTANYKGVWHFADDFDESAGQSDSTGNGFKASYVSNIAKSGIGDTSSIGKAFYRTLDANTAAACFNTPNLTSTMKMNWNGVTLSGWAYYKGYGATGQQHLLWISTSSSGSYYWGINTQNKTLRSKFGTATAETIGTGLNPASGWFHWALRVTNQTTYEYFLNGVLLKTLTKDSKYSTQSTTSQWTCGGTTGYLDEYRYRNVASSEDWVKAEYDSIKNKDFVIASDAVKNDGGFIIVVQ